MPATDARLPLPCRHTYISTHNLYVFLQVAYVLGQMQHPATATALGTVLADLGEHQMVRHEVRKFRGSVMSR